MLSSLDFIKPMIGRCLKEHETCWQKSETDLPPGFRLVDIVRRRIVELNNVPFVALSYVWGTGSRPSLLRAMRGTTSGMKRDNGLPNAHMPQVIEDAMTVCTRLGERYLWVDRLCIVQDDPIDKSNQIEAMDDIYSTARLVLIAACGEDMDSGLYGISRPRHEIQKCEDVSGLHIRNAVQESLNNPLALWQTRGWTYQEAVLAKRCLYFTDVQLIFNCQSSFTYEDACYPPDTVTVHDHGLHKRFSKSRFQDFKAHLPKYTSRSLSYQSDVYNAMTGIMRALYGKSCELIYGLPQEDFDRALLWVLIDPDQSGFSLNTSEIVCPTWSWSSAMKHPGYATYQERRELYGTLIIWHRTKDVTHSTDCQLQAINFPSKIGIHGDWALHMAIACEEGLLENVPALCSLKNDSFSTIREKSHARWPDYLSYYRELENSALSLDFLKHALKPGILLSRAQSGFARLKLSSNGSYLHIVGSAGDLIGEIFGSVTQVRNRISSSNDYEDVLHEFIALSLWDEARPQGKRDDEKSRTKEYYDADNQRLDRFLVVNVLLIGWREQYAYRKAAGWISLKDWVKVQPQWKTVLLK